MPGCGVVRYPPPRKGADLESHKCEQVASPSRPGTATPAEHRRSACLPDPCLGGLACWHTPHDPGQDTPRNIAGRASRGPALPGGRFSPPAASYICMGPVPPYPFGGLLLSVGFWRPPPLPRSGSTFTGERETGLLMLIADGSCTCFCLGDPGPREEKEQLFRM